MSVEFGRAIRDLLLSDGPTAALVPGGIHPDEVPATQVEIRQGPAAVYYVMDSSPLESITRTMDAEKVTLGFSFLGATTSQVSAFKKKAWTLIKANRVRYTDGIITIAGLHLSGGGTSTIRVLDGDDESIRKIDFTITGYVGS